MSPSIERLKDLPNWPASLDEVQAAAFAARPLTAFRRAVARGDLRTKKGPTTGAGA